MIRLGLESIRSLCGELGNPQDKLRFIHISGTNGKGSTLAFVESILKESGIKVGTFSSPAVFKREEVIRINKRPISKRNYDIYLKRVEEACDILAQKGSERPTEFEMETALALLYFADNCCDITVMECGMGGETDSTNIIENTAVCIFTSISIDHTDYLGDCVAKIAKVKSGIIKPKARVVISENNSDAVPIILDKAKEMNCLVNITQTTRFGKKELSLMGECQNENASIAVSAVRELIEHSRNNISLYSDELRDKLEGIGEKVIKSGLKKAINPGRFEKICDKPVIIIDGAHNEGAAKALGCNLKKYYQSKNINMIVGMLVNKDHDSVMKELAPLAGNIFTVSTKGGRYYSAEELARDIVKYNERVTSIGGIEEALELAVAMTDSGSIIVVFGTFTILDETRKWVRKWKDMM